MLKYALLSCCVGVSAAADSVVSIYKEEYPEPGHCGQENNVTASQLNPHYFFPMHFGGFHEGSCADGSYTHYVKTEVVEMHPMPWISHNLTFDVYSRPATQMVPIQLEDPDRPGRKVLAKVCMPSAPANENKQYPLYIFGHGFSCAPDDYAYFCNVAATVLVYQKTGPFDTDTANLAADAAFLAAEIPRLSKTDTTSPLFGKLAGPVVLGGHSMGGGTSILAASKQPLVQGMALFAPGLYTKPDATPFLKTITMPALIVSGSDDCGQNALPKEAQPAYDGLASEVKVLVVLKGANHCGWTHSTEIVGVCKLNECHELDTASQHRFGTELVAAFIQGLNSTESWNGFEQMLAEGDAKGTWTYVSSKTSPSGKKINNDCPCGKSVGDATMVI